MSIEYFVEGNVKMQTGGDHLIKSKGTVKNNTSVSVEQKGTDTGVSHNKADKINHNDKPVNSIDVSLNLFFDGTQNNKTNTLLGGDYEEASSDKDDSYNNDFTNVARGFDAIDPNAENQVRWYIEGIGTEDKEGDSILKGVAQGTGDTGVVAKVTKGCIKGAEQLKKYAGKEIVLKINVFGFSRGSAAARHFVHVATNPARVLMAGREKGIAIPPYDSGVERIAVKLNDPLLQYGYFGACLIQQKVQPKKIIFNFVGLYDTVAAYGLNHRGGAGIDNDTKQLGLDAIKKAYFVLHLASDDEYRDNFDLTNINSTGLHGLELTLPGVHSDIGGSYNNMSKELSVLYCDSYDPYDNVKTHKECVDFKKIVKEEGWYDDSEMEIKYFYQDEVGNDKLWNKGLLYYGLIGIRKQLYNTYDKIPLNTMFHYSRQEQFGVKYDDTIIKDSLQIKDSFINSIYNQLLGYMNACNTFRNGYVEDMKSGKNPSANEYIKGIKNISYLDYINNEDLKKLRNKYLHWSVKANQLGLSGKPYDNAPKKKGAVVSKYRKRNIQNG